MSKSLDPNDLSQDDIEYIKQRPWLREEMILQGYDDPLPDPKAPASPLQVTYSPSALPNDKYDDEYDSWKNKELTEEVEKRGLEPNGEKNADLIEALRKDDAQKAESESE